MKDNTKIDNINLSEALTRNRRLLIARKRPNIRSLVWGLALGAVLGLLFLANGVLIVILRLIGN